MKIILRLIIYSLLFVVVTLSSLWFTGARFNSSPSVPVGLYWTINKSIQKKDFVSFCPPLTSNFKIASDRNYFPKGSCPGGSTFLIKQVLAMKGDVITSNKNGVYINGHLVPYSKPFIEDVKGRHLPNFKIKNYRLKESELLLMTNQSITSFDARYFGLINKSQISAVLKSIITW